MTCTVCGKENGHLAVVCTHCGAYLQGKTENLDLFATSWGIIERPRRTFHFISIARHKNYVFFLSSIAGIAFAFLFFWILKVGEYSDTLFNIIVAGTATGPFIGIGVVLSYALLVKLASLIIHGQARFIQIYAVASYALVPVVASVVLILPIELMTFGTYFFTRNPSPYTINPGIYMALVSLDGAFALWTVMLLAIGFRTLFNLAWSRILFILIVSILFLTAGGWLVLSRLLHAGL